MYSSDRDRRKGEKAGPELDLGNWIQIERQLEKLEQISNLVSVTEEESAARILGGIYLHAVFEHPV